MNIRNRREIRHAASQALNTASGNPRMVVLIYAGITCLLTLISTFVSYYLNGEIAETGGLSNLGLRSILTTIQTILPFVQVLVALGLEVGYCSAMLDVVRGRSAEPRSLLYGFYRFWPMALSAVFMTMICFAVIMGALYLSVWIYMLLPAYDTFYQIMEPYLESMTTMTAMTATLTMDDATLFAAADAMIPMLWIFAALCCIALPPVLYQYRMVTYCIADADHPRALIALGESRRMMRRNRFALFRLDLGFWWYYLLQMLVTLVCYGDILLPMLGVALPWSAEVSYFLFFLLSLALQMVVFLCLMNKVTVTYATAYEALRPKPQQNSVPLGNIFDM